MSLSPPLITRTSPLDVFPPNFPPADFSSEEHPFLGFEILLSNVGHFQALCVVPFLRSHPRTLEISGCLMCSPLPLATYLHREPVETR